MLFIDPIPTGIELKPIEVSLTLSGLEPLDWRFSRSADLRKTSAAAILGHASVNKFKLRILNPVAGPPRGVVDTLLALGHSAFAIALGDCRE